MDAINTTKLSILTLLAIISTACATVSPKTCNTSMTDNDITTNVQVKIGAEDGLNDQLIRVSTYERVVTLSGWVQNPTQQNVAYVLARSVPNVKYVKSTIKIKRRD
jgi:osmotically-inducible protein OsmY